MGDTVWKKSSEKKPNDTGPYAHWWTDKERAYIPEDILRGFAATELELTRSSPMRDTEAAKVAGALYSDGAVVPIPEAFANTSRHEDWEFEHVAERLPNDIPDGTVITGILDTGIALSHMMTNITAGETRVIAAWQQGTPMVNDDKGVRLQPWLPCGREVFAGEINQKLRQYGDGTGVVDEEAFNRDLGVTTPEVTLGNRDLEMAAAHGTHTLSLAAGFDPKDHDAETLAKQRIIAVNLPAQFSHGTGGNFLSYFAIYGLARILHLADALWEKNVLSKKGAKPDCYGYPIVINFSYGMVAGPKDGYHVFEDAFRKILRSRELTARGFKGGASPVRIMMPVGNDNLKRGAASSVLGANGVTNKHGYTAEPEITLPWRIQPGDATANFLEIWTEAMGQRLFKNDLLKNLKVFVTPPGQPETKLENLDNNNIQDLGNYARVYSQQVKIGPFDTNIQSDSSAIGVADSGNDNSVYRLALLVCVAPTTIDLKGAPTAPAGLWNVKVQYDGNTPVDFTFYIQSDQSAVVTSKTGLRSYFDHPNYRTHLTEHDRQYTSKRPDELFRDESASVADTFSFDVNKGPIDNDDWKAFGPVQRRGTNNALSTLFLQEIIVVGSYDDSNGFPTAYSSSTDGNPQGNYSHVLAEERDAMHPEGIHDARTSLTILYPGENAPTLFGILGAGARDGSVVGSRGTSMSTALATRAAGQAFLTADRSQAEAFKKTASEAWFRANAAVFEDQATSPKSDAWGQPSKWPGMGQGGFLKMGTGRQPDPRGPGKVRRIGGAD